MEEASRSSGAPWAVAAGCASPRAELERVAKDWCMTIRASQVLPVYPSSEDVQPGDVFVVQVPLSEQPDLYDGQGSFRFTQASRRSVAMEQAFDRPLVIGYLGFDVRVDPEGRLSPPIPSFAVLKGRIDEFPEAVPYAAAPLSDAYLDWLPRGDHFAQVAAWLQQEGIQANPADLANAEEHSDTLRRLAQLHGGFELQETVEGGEGDGR